MAYSPVGRTLKLTADPGPVLVKGSPTSNYRVLERMVNHRTLSAQRVLHNHILELGERFSPKPCPSCTCSSPGSAHSTQSLSSGQDVGGETESDRPWTEVFTQLAEEEKERALQKQKETLQAQFAEALSARDRLEAELRLGQRVELLAQFEQQQASLRAEMEKESRLAVEEACARVRAQVLREAAETRRREAEAFEAQTQERLERREEEVDRRVRVECAEEARKDRQTLQDRHTDELNQLRSIIQRLEERLDRVTQEKMRYEREFKKVQCSYRQFVDLTDSSLHSDYLLKLRRLGREPGLTESEAQTDDIINVCPTPQPLSCRRVL